MSAEAFGHLRELVAEIVTWLGSDLFAYATIGQLALLVLSGLAAILLGRALLRLFDRLREDIANHERLRLYLAPLVSPLLTLLLIGTLNLAAAEIELPRYLFGVAMSLLSAWLVIRLAVNLIASRALQKLVATIAWSIAALNIVGLLDPIMRTLDAARLSTGELSISALAIINGAFLFVLLIWLALFLARLLESRIDRLADVNASARELAKKLSRILLVIFSILLALNATGIDLTALAVFSGALGVGIGFGLQKVVANFISGVILLMDRSIKPGDVIETQNTYGWINHLGARYTSIITRDGTEFLIPNEDMITQPVVNWSFSDRRVRRKIPVSIAYESDVRKAMALMEQAALSAPRVLRNPPPVSRLMKFGDNGVDLELRLWIEDPQAGVVNVASDVMLAIRDLFEENGIIFPYPHRVIEIKGSPPTSFPGVD